MYEKFHPLSKGSVKLLPGLFQERFDLNRKYMLSLKSENLLQNYYMEAGLWNPATYPGDIHWGWESPTSQLRGHFLGHWLSGAAHIYANTGDQEIKGKADYIISELARCQRENGGEWAGSIPERYLEWTARGKPVWAPHYTLHKTLMGLWDMYAVGGNAQSLDILARWASWFHRWTGRFSLEQMDDILDNETGGMLEVWANLYGATGEREHYELIQRYDRRRLFDPLIAGKDVLTNMHMNTTIPEVHGAARAWEVTGEDRWRQVAENYWRLGVTERGYYATGGQTNGEVWSPPGELSARLGFRTQEHCTVYNMMRLADYFQRWTGDPAYGDYWERNLWNGILAQQHPETGMITYFLPLHAGAEKVWGTPTEDFWCCHGSLVQAQAIYANHAWYEDEHGLVLNQYIPSTVDWGWQDAGVRVTLSEDAQRDQPHRPQSAAYEIQVNCAQAVEFSLRFRLPWWIAAAPEVTINGQPQAVECAPSSYLELRRTWNQDSVRIRLPKALCAVALPDDPGMFAFMDGPVVLAALNPGRTPSVSRRRPDGSLIPRPRNYSVDGITLYGNPRQPETFIIPDDEREWHYWRGDYRTAGQPRDVRLIPLYEVRDEVYTVYFPVRSAQ
jgi:DUF1680 family protein